MRIGLKGAWPVRVLNRRLGTELDAIGDNPAPALFAGSSCGLGPRGVAVTSLSPGRLKRSPNSPLGALLPEGGLLLTPSGRPNLSQKPSFATD